MYYQSLSTQNFRNLNNATLDFSPGVNVFFGQNGQGKSNLLEAILLTSSQHSFRSLEKLSVINRNTHNSPEPFAALKTMVTRNQMDSKIEVYFSSHRRKTVLNGKATNANFLAHRFPIVVFSPDSLSAIKEGPEQRRRLIDDFLLSSSPEAEKIMSEYLQCLRQRNQLLRLLKENPHSAAESLMLESVTDIFINLASEFTWIRLKGLESLQERVGEVLKVLFGIEGDPDNEFEFRYLLSHQVAVAMSKSEIADAIRRRGVELAVAERVRGTSLVGPHKHDLQFHWRGANSRFFSSQGQQRSIILAFKMAQIRYHFELFGEPPVLLLDDVLSELDEERRGQLLEFLAQMTSQIFLTATDQDVGRSFDQKRVASYLVADGKVLRADS